MKEFTIGRNDAGQRLDRFVSKAAPLIPESLLQKTLRKKDIKINGRPAKGETRLAEGDTVRVYLPDEFFEAPREENAWRKITAPRLEIRRGRTALRPRSATASTAIPAAS